MIDKIQYIGPSKLNDNELSLFSDMLSIITHADPDFIIKIDKRVDEVLVHITPSNFDFRKNIIDNLLHFNRTKRKYRVRFSSSLAISKIISFKISLDKILLN